MNIGETAPHTSIGERISIWKMLEYQILLTRSALVSILLEPNLLGSYQHLNCPWEGTIQLEPHLAILSLLRWWGGGSWEALMKYTVDRRKLTKTRKPNHKTIERFSPTAYHSITTRNPKHEFERIHAPLCSLQPYLHQPKCGSSPSAHQEMSRQKTSGIFTQWNTMQQ